MASAAGHTFVQNLKVNSVTPLTQQFGATQWQYFGLIPDSHYDISELLLPTRHFKSSKPHVRKGNNPKNKNTKIKKNKKNKKHWMELTQYMWWSKAHAYNYS